MNVELSDNSLRLGFGTQFSIRKVSKNGFSNEIKLINGSEDNVFIGIFDEEDVDFDICIDNRLSDKSIAFDLSIRSYQTFIVRSGKVSILKSLETNGRKLHLKSQNTDEGELLVAMKADMHRISYEKASIDCSKITFNINVEKEKKPLNSIVIKGDEITIEVKSLNNEITIINVGLNNTIEELKAIVEDEDGTPLNKQIIIYNGRQLEDQRTVQDYNITDESVVHLALRLIGGGSCPLDISEASHSSETYSSSGTMSDSEEEEDLSNTSKSGNNQKVFSGERGVICYGEKSDQRFEPCIGFERDYHYIINSFTIQFRMASKYSPV